MIGFDKKMTGRLLNAHVPAHRKLDLIRQYRHCFVNAFDLYLSA